MYKRLSALIIMMPAFLPVQAAGLTCGGPGTQQTATAYTAAGGEKVAACFDVKAKNCTLQLPVGRMVTLPAAVSLRGPGTATAGKPTVNLF